MQTIPTLNLCNGTSVMQVLTYAKLTEHNTYLGKNDKGIEYEAWNVKVFDGMHIAESFKRTYSEPTKVEVYIEYLDKETNDLVSEWDETYTSIVEAQLATQESLHMYCHHNQVFKVYFIQGIHIVGVWHCQRMYNETTLVVSWEVSPAIAPMGNQGTLRQFEVVHLADSQGWMYSDIPSQRKLSMLGISDYYTWGSKTRIEELSLEHPIAIQVA